MSDHQTTAISILQPTDIGLPESPQSDPRAVTNALRFAAEHANVLAPVTQITFIPPSYQIEFMVLQFPTEGIQTYTRDGKTLASKNAGNKHWYAVSGGKLTPHKAPLEMLARSAGVSWRPITRLDDGSHPYYWHFQAELLIMGMDGVERPWSRSATYDLRSNSSGMTAAATKAAGQDGVNGTALREARIHGGRRCESMAALATIRAALGVQSYTWEEAQRPFVLPVLRFVPDMGNPVIAEMVAAKALGITAELYGSRATAEAGARAAEAGQSTPPPPPTEQPRQLPPPDQVPQDPPRERQRVPVSQQRDPWDRGEEPPPTADPRRSDNSRRPSCTPCTPCGLPLSETQARRTADLDGGPYCQDCQPNV